MSEPTAMSTSSVIAAPATRVLAAPVGDLTISATVRGISRVDFGPHPARIDDTVDPAAVALLDQAERELAEYFAGQRQEFTVPLDLPEMSPFRTKALAAMQEIGYGKTVTYAELASAAGREKAARAAGGACAKNPIPVFIPCHRVLPATGGIGNYGGGTPLKAHLLALEGWQPLG